MTRMPFVALLVLALSSLMQANVVYSFSGSFNVGQVVSFTLTVPNPIIATGTTGLTPDASFVPGPQLTCDACTQIDFYVDAVARGFAPVPSNVVAYGVTNGVMFTSYFFYFAPQSFTVNGTYGNVINGFSNQGTLQVSGITPEPGTLVMVVSGLGLLGRSWQRRVRLTDEWPATALQFTKNLQAGSPLLLLTLVAAKW